jgi:hypothetical protein
LAAPGKTPCFPFARGDRDDLRFDNTRITDTGLVHLAELREWRYLCLRGTKVTAVGAANLERRCPQVNVDKP